MPRSSGVAWIVEYGRSLAWLAHRSITLPGGRLSGDLRNSGRTARRARSTRQASPGGISLRSGRKLPLQADQSACRDKYVT